MGCEIVLQRARQGRQGKARHQGAKPPRQWLGPWARGREMGLRNETGRRAASLGVSRRQMSRPRQGAPTRRLWSQVVASTRAEPPRQGKTEDGCKRMSSTGGSQPLRLQHEYQASSTVVRLCRGACQETLARGPDPGFDRRAHQGASAMYPVVTRVPPGVCSPAAPGAASADATQKIPRGSHDSAALHSQRVHFASRSQELQHPRPTRKVAEQSVAPVTRQTQGSRHRESARHAHSKTVFLFFFFSFPRGVTGAS